MGVVKHCSIDSSEAGGVSLVSLCTHSILSLSSSFFFLLFLLNKYILMNIIVYYAFDVEHWLRSNILSFGKIFMNFLSSRVCFRLLLCQRLIFPFFKHMTQLCNWNIVNAYYYIHISVSICMYAFHSVYIEASISYDDLNYEGWRVLVFF